MKKILVVEDNNENLDVAKAFFSTVNGFEFIYATNRLDAVSHIDEAYAVITDKDMPHNIFGTGDKSMEQVNGNWIAIHSKGMGKPVIMASEHGILGIGLVDDSDEKRFQRCKLDVNNLVYSDDITIDDWRNLHHDLIDILMKIDYRHPTTKKKESAWKIAWEKLQEQF